MMPEETMVVETKAEEPTKDYVNGQVYEVKVNDLKPNPYQPRKYFDGEAQDTLAESIRDLGLIQPISFGKSAEGYIVVAGTCRLEAFKKAGRETIPAMFTNQDPEEVAICENLQRNDLNPIDLAESLQHYMTRKGLTQVDLAKNVGRPKSTVSEILSLNKLTYKIKDGCRGKNKVRLRDLIKMAKESSMTQLTMFNKLLESKQRNKPDGKSDRRQQAWRERFNSVYERFTPILSAKNFGMLDGETGELVVGQIDELIKLLSGAREKIRSTAACAVMPGVKEPPSQHEDDAP